MGRMSRDKGAAGEREFAAIAREAGLEAERTAQLQAGRRVEGSPDVTVYTWPELHVEVKRDERMSVDAMVRQSVRDAAAYRGDARVPLVAWRRNGSGRKGWRIDCPAAHYLGLLAEVQTLRAELDRREYARRDAERATVGVGYPELFETPEECRARLAKTSHESATPITTEDHR